MWQIVRKIKPTTLIMSTFPDNSMINIQTYVNSRYIGHNQLPPQPRRGLMTVLTDEEYYAGDLTREQQRKAYTYTYKGGKIFDDCHLVRLLVEAKVMMTANKLEDRIIHIQLPIEDERTRDGVKPIVVAGSAALHMYIANCGRDVMTPVTSWKPTDVDLFTLCCENRRRYTLKCHGTDNVNVMFKNVEDLIMNFDLPICRVAYSTGHLWISLQALYCIHMTGTYPLPIYFNDLLKYKQVTDNGKPKTVLMKKLITDYFYKVNGRVEKYALRGFKPEWIDTREPVSYVKSQFLNLDSFFNSFIDYN